MLLDPKIPAKIANLDRTYHSLRFAPVADIPMEMALTREHYRTPPPPSVELKWDAIAEGTQWGDNWISAWFRGRVRIPESMDATPAFVRADTGAPESLFIVNGLHYGVFDVNHPVRLMDLEAKAGNSYEIYLEAYAGHTFPGTQPFAAGGLQNDPAEVVTPNCRTFRKIELVKEIPEVSAFVFELRALHQLAGSLDEHSLRRGKILAAMQEVFRRAYAKPHEVPVETWRAALMEARRAMRPLLDSTNGPTTPRFGIIGHSHIDSAWLWPIRETIRKCARTFSSILSLMDQYPEFRFTQSAACHGDWMRRHYPDIFRRMQLRVKERRWEINGAMWIEPDCNIPGGESFVRQCLIGQQATRQWFGVTSDTLWQPDVFGYSSALPQILRGAGVKYFCTTKLGWNDTNRFPYDTFKWRGIDGTEIYAHFNATHCWPDPETLLREWKWVQHKDNQDRRLMAFGYGDGGGGPQCEMIEMARVSTDLEGCPRLHYSSISEFMSGVERELGPSLPVFVGELYLENHRGTLTSVAAIKRANRQCEIALRDAEFLSVLATVRTGSEYPSDALRETWEILLLNQFHDILPGSSIAEVNDEAIREFSSCLNKAYAIRDSALSRISPPDSGSNLLVVNSLSWDRRDEMILKNLPRGLAPIGAAAQEIEDAQGSRGLAVHGLKIPAMGFAAVAMRSFSSGASPFLVNGNSVETPFAKVEFDDGGEIRSFYQKDARRELIATDGWFNRLLIGEDVPGNWDNWDIDRDQHHKLRPLDGPVSRRVVADGPLQLRIRLEYKLGQVSSLVQHVVFHSTSPRVDFDTVVNWQEKYQLLKTEFALDLVAESARHEIQFGHVVRAAHDNTTWDRAQFDVCSHKWSDISENGFGVAFLNDCKYGCNFKFGKYSLSLIKSGRHPDARGDEGIHRFIYAMLPHLGFSVESVVRPAYEFNIPPLTCNSVAPIEPLSFVTVSDPNVIIESVKWAEEGNAFTVRLYEAGKRGTHATLRFAVSVRNVELTNLLEEDRQSMTMQEPGRVDVYLRPFQVLTLRCEV